VRRLAAIVVVALLACAGEAAASTTARVPLGQWFSGLDVSSTGQAWVTARRPSGGAWGIVNGSGRPVWRSVTARDGGLLAARPDGGMWIVSDASMVLRVAPDGTLARFGPIELPGRDEAYPVLAAGTPDGALVLTRSLGRFVRVAPDGTVSAHNVALPAPTNGLTGCFGIFMAARADGSLSLSDAGCRRVLDVTLAGAVTQRTLTPEDPSSRRATPFGLLPRADGSLWFAAGLTLSGSAIGRIAPDGGVVRLATPGSPNDVPEHLAEAPDGSVWSNVSGACALFRVVGDRVERVGVPFPVLDLRFDPAGGLWLRGQTRLEHLSAAEVAALPPSARCDLRAPRFTLPDRRGRTLSLRTLRRAGLRIRTSEASHLWGSVSLLNASAELRVDRVLRRGQTVALRVPPGILDGAARRLARGRAADLGLYVGLTDSNGNRADPPGGANLRLVR